MKVDVLLGLQWGDEGKGKIVDVLTPQYDIIARFQGGPNAGHTLIFDGKKHVLQGACFFLLAGAADIPAAGEIPHDRVNLLARKAIKRVRRLGWVGLVERGDQTWHSLSDRLGTTIRPQPINVTEVRPDRPADFEGVLSERSTILLAARTAGDALVWREIATLTGVENPDVLADVAWNRRLMVTMRNAATG